MHSQQRMDKRTHRSAIGAVTLPPATWRSSLRSALRRGCAPPTAAAGVVSSPRGSSAPARRSHAPIGHSRLLLPRLSPPPPGPALHCGACSRGCRDYNPQGPARPPVGSGQRLVCGNRGRRFLLAGASGAASGALEGSGGVRWGPVRGWELPLGSTAVFPFPACARGGASASGGQGGPLVCLRRAWLALRGCAVSNSFQYRGLAAGGRGGGRSGGASGTSRRRWAQPRASPCGAGGGCPCPSLPHRDSPALFPLPSGRGCSGTRARPSPCPSGAGEQPRGLPGLRRPRVA